MDNTHKTTGKLYKNKSLELKSRKKRKRGKQTTKIVNVCGRNTQEISVLCTVNNSKYHSAPFPVHLKTTLKTRLVFRSNKGSRR